ncbi:hypothetical protein P153DRAFT_367380 [Dothidotthia symphoricarpi CBS 119687]|uniref:Mif2/CENP-C cupin domain-containing protein n=1 Tax=Dothidotthia symphoricarpi CBS 119687 TaxID=1392245 RepID=A0A6A6ADA5_9PLEO|nr:uncharacterized protein P153DRAFT_367380 [Dothidotthia symphoricarpi CBS 119687]KAF2129105.1 hypothetical protein P153DRAFT_367380 [Dothidotthia symphoricarpi CBS 119687]
MAPQRKRENRENNFYNVGVQGRKTGITLEERERDEYGLEAISGMFSSPEKSPPKRVEIATGSESMDIQESSIPDLTTSKQILRNNRTLLPPPRARSPMKTTLGSSPRRQSSMAPRASSVGLSSPVRATSHSAVARRLDFEQDESSLQETPALSGSGQRRNRPSDIYAIEQSPTHSLPEESLLQEEIAANEAAADTDDATVESFFAQIGDETITGTEAEVEVSPEIEEEVEVVPTPVKQPAKRGRKRKSDALEPATVEEPQSAKSRKRGANPAQVTEPQKKSKKTAPAPAEKPRRSKRTSDITELEQSNLDDSTIAVEDASEQVEEPPVAPKRRGRPPKAKPAAVVEKEKKKEIVAPAKVNKNASSSEKENPVFKKPAKPTAKPKSKPDAQTTEKAPQAAGIEPGKAVDAYGNPLSKADIDRMSTASTGSRYGRGRHLSVYREMDPEAVARVGRTGRHRVNPIDFWKNDRITYNTDGSMASIVKAPDAEPGHKTYKSTTKKGKKRMLTAVEEEEIELDAWEAGEGILTGNYKGFDRTTNFASKEVMTDRAIAWAPKGIDPVEAGDGTFKYAKIGQCKFEGSKADFLSWGVLEIPVGQMKRSKNSRKMHMVFNVQSGTVEAKVDENEFTVHKSGVWQVPRGNIYSIKNIGSGTARVFFAQACEDPE